MNAAYARFLGSKVQGFMSPSSEGTVNKKVLGESVFTLAVGFTQEDHETRRGNETIWIHEDPVTGEDVFQKSGRYLMSLSKGTITVGTTRIEGGTIFFYHLDTKEVFTIPPPEEEIIYPVFVASGDTTIYLANGKTIRRILPTGSPTVTLGDIERINVLRLSGDGSLFVAADNTLRLLNSSLSTSFEEGPIKDFILFKGGFMVVGDSYLKRLDRRMQTEWTLRFKTDLGEDPISLRDQPNGLILLFFTKTLQLDETDPVMGSGAVDLALISFSSDGRWRKVRTVAGVHVDDSTGLQRPRISGGKVIGRHLINGSTQVGIVVAPGYENIDDE